MTDEIVSVLNDVHNLNIYIALTSTMWVINQRKVL